MDANAPMTFDEWVEERLAELIRLGEREFGSLVSRLPGVYPTDALAGLQRLQARRDLNGHPVALIDSSLLDRSPQAWGSVELGLPHPHPLDYEWRFGPEGVALLADRCNRLTKPSDHVALVATPTVAMTRGAIFRNRPVTYIGADTSLLARHSQPSHIHAARHANLLEVNQSTRRFAAVVMDPPWYDEHLQRFLWFAASAAHLGGVLLLAMPALGTRPGVAEEHARCLTWCSQLGFELEHLEPGTLPYETPLFERNALRAAGILNIPAHWRRGDLWILRKVKANRATWPGDLARSAWTEYRFGPVRLRVDRGTGVSSGDPALVSLLPGDVLPTVSRRDVRRQLARVWTTGNRVFGCSNPDEFARILEDWQAGSWSARADDSITREVIAQMNAILDVEGQEVDCQKAKLTSSASDARLG